jgi:DNA polymerase IIIc chi subunit
VECVSGKPDDPTRDILINGSLEVSADGKSFRKVAEFAYGAAKAELNREKVKAVRITATADGGRDWVILQDLILK